MNLTFYFALLATFQEGAKRAREKRGRGAYKNHCFYPCGIYFVHRVKHSQNEFANGKNHINGIENFWGYCKLRLSKFKGIKKEVFYLHLKETENEVSAVNLDIISKFKAKISIKNC